MKEAEKTRQPLPKPPWLRKRLPAGGKGLWVDQALKDRHLHTICEEGQCPNRGECYNLGVATFLILGKVCTRGCTFCAVATGRGEAPDPEEPARVAEQVAELGLKFVVITSVTRDDLPDGGAAHFAATTRAIKERRPGVGVEILTPDFKGDFDHLALSLSEPPEVFAHNVETVPRLYPGVRPQANYRRSLAVLAKAAEMGGKWAVKSGLMVGLGETKEEVFQVMADLRESGCRLITIGQFLSPSPQHHPVVEYVHPDIFALYENQAKKMGFDSVASGPFVRSSYLAEHYYRTMGA